MDFSTISGKNIASGIASKFDVGLSSRFSPDTLNSAEKKLVDRITILIQSAELGELRVKDHYEIGREESDDDESQSDWDYEDEEEEKKPEKKAEPTKEMFDKALCYYRSGKSRKNKHGEGVQSFETMKKQFRIFSKNRNEQLHTLAELLDKKVTSLIDEGYELHDHDLKYLANNINDEITKCSHFEASDSWILRWKRQYRIVSRHITVLVSQKTKKDLDKTRKLVENLRTEVDKIVKANPGICIRNADQTGLTKEQHGRRTLAHKGSKRVEALVQSKSATSHSITLLPVIGSDGFQEKKLFVQLGEAGGKLPMKGCYRSPTLEIAVSTSHIMTKQTAIQFYKNVLFAPPVPPKLLLLLDSWPAFRDHQTIRASCPTGVELFIFNIPPGATSLCQPADLSYNHAIKAIQRRLTAMVLIRDIPYKISERDNILRFASQVHWSIGADRFKGFISYGFYKGGFVQNRPTHFESPKDFMFGKKSNDLCPCSERGCTLCAHCSKAYCFKCFWVDMHRC